MRRVRGRFDVLIPLGTGYVRITSDKDKSLTREEITQHLREWLDRIERANALKESE